MMVSRRFFENGDLSLACYKVACDNLEIALRVRFSGSDVHEVILGLGGEVLDVLLLLNGVSCKL